MPLGAVSQAVTSTERAVWEKTDSTIMAASGSKTTPPTTTTIGTTSQTWSTQHASFLQPESNVQYDGYIIQSDKIFTYKSHVPLRSWEPQMGRKRYIIVI